MEKNTVLYYRCKACGTKIPSNTGGGMVGCDCGKIAIDGDGYIARIIGNVKYLDSVCEIKEMKMYRIKQLSSNLYFIGGAYNKFTKNGRVYTKKPSLRWVELFGECVIEEYKVVIN